MTFYRNTILHLFALPGLVATLIERHEGIDEAGLLAACQPLYPLMQRELFLRQEVSALPTAIAELLAALQQEGLIEYRAQGYWVCATEQQRACCCWHRASRRRCNAMR